MHEIVTVQLGHEANHAATHFWNAQEAYFRYGDEAGPVDHDRSFRAGLNAQGHETYTPRTVVYDLKGRLGGLSRWGLYEQPEVEPGCTWSGKVTVDRKEPSRSEYQRVLDRGESAVLSAETTQAWSDYSRVFYHPRSIVQIHDFEIHSNLLAFDQHSTGQELFDCEDDILDRDLRPWMEECDRIQAVQVYTGSDDGWAGFADRYLEKLQDEYGKTSIWVWGIARPSLPSSKHVVNKARLVLQAASTASIYVPLTARWPSIALDSPWYRSAIVSAAAETALLPSRLRSDHQLVHQTAAALTHNHQNIVDLSLQTANHTECLYDGDAKAVEPHVFSSVETVRGEKDLAYPQPDSFPPVFDEIDSMRTRMSTNTSIGEDLRSKRQLLAKRAPLEDRETLVSSLADLADLYSYGWHSDSDVQ